jgi:hypothetical protein
VSLVSMDGFMLELVSKYFERRLTQMYFKMNADKTITRKTNLRLSI